jgi:CubicO group peptidase (beta-lactamase class C family)
MDTNVFQSHPVPSTDDVRGFSHGASINRSKRPALSWVSSKPGGRRVVAYGPSRQGDPRAVDGDTIFEIGSVSKVFTSLLLADMVHRKEVALDDPAARHLPEHVRMPEGRGTSIHAA